VTSGLFGDSNVGVESEPWGAVYKGAGRGGLEGIEFADLAFSPDGLTAGRFEGESVFKNGPGEGEGEWIVDHALIGDAVVERRS